MTQEYNSQSSSPYDTGGYDSYSTIGIGYSNQGFQRLNGLEIIVIIVCILSLIGAGLWGLFTSNTSLRDQQRKAHIEQVLTAMNQFYQNSSFVPSLRRYPIAVCSNNLNEVDYESTLRLHLIGKQRELDSHIYINEDNFPRDRWGEYATSFDQKKTKFRCPNILQEGANNYDDSYPSCDFSSTRNLNKCYLYSSSTNGDSFQLAYWSEVNNRFVVYSKFRDNQVTISTVD